MYKIYLYPIELSDGSMVYDIGLRLPRLPCTTESDARVLIEKITAALKEHTDTELRLVEMEPMPG